MQVYKNKKAGINKAAFFIAIILILATLTSAQLHVTTFNNTLDTLSLSFEVAHDPQSFFISVPNGTVSIARMTLEGFDLAGRSFIPADVILVTDVSGSMGADISTNLTKMAAARTADNAFLNNVDFRYVHVGLSHYSYWGTGAANTDLDSNLTDNQTFLSHIISHYIPRSNTNMGGGMEYALRALTSSLSQTSTDRYMIVMTDGWANCYASDFSIGVNGAGFCGGSSYYDNATDYVRYVVALARAQNITIYGIAFGTCSHTYQVGADCDFMQEITTDGTLYNAPDADTLRRIYRNIARNISVTQAPTPSINTTIPASRFGWRYPSLFSGGGIVWDGNSCGDSNASCNYFRDLIQYNLNRCTSNPCNISFRVDSSTVGMLNLSDLYIEINEPPVSNYPPNGTCLAETMACRETLIRPLNDSVMVTDPNDDLNTLSWVLNNSVESPGGAFFNLRSNYNASRYLNFSINPAHVNDSFWKTYYFNVSDPWGEKTKACINVSYTGCAATAPLLNISDRTIIFNITSQPGFHYNLRNMVDNNTNTPCTIDQLAYRFLPPYDNTDTNNNFIIWGPDSQGNITIIPNNPEDWFTPTSQSVTVEAFCPAGGTSDGRTYTRRGKADVILITDFSGSMKKAVNLWDDMGTGRTSCEELYNDADARKAQLANCLDENFTNTVMSYENNRIWPVYIHGEIELPGIGTSHCASFDPTNSASIVNCIYAGGRPQGTGETCLACAINGGYDILYPESDERNRFVVFMTDGLPTHCAQGSCTDGTTSNYLGGAGEGVCLGYCDVPGSCQSQSSTAGCYDEGCLAAEGSTLYSTARLFDNLGATFYTISFGAVEQCTRNRELLGTMASISDGEYHHSSDVNELRRIYNDIATKITQISENVTDPPYHFIIADNATLTIRYTAQSPNCPDGSQNLPWEECDLGSSGNNNFGTCSEICTLTYCSDNRVQTPNGRDSLWEACDDGNVFSGDGCNSTCGREWCGDHYLQPGLGEQCDDGDSQDNGDGCVGCQLQVSPECGNVIIELGEECDDGNHNPDDGCDECVVTRIKGCGNAVIEDGEGCDDGNHIPDDGCDECRLIPLPFCPNGVIEENEQCDDNNTINGDGCSDMCRGEGNPRCGNRVEESGESCDDGCLAGNPLICDSADNGDGCEMNCSLTLYPVLSISDTTIRFNYSARPGYNYTLDDMLSPYAVLPVDESTLSFTITRIFSQQNFSITPPINPDGNITIVPTYNGWMDATSEMIRVDVSSGSYHDTAYLTIIYTAEGAPEGQITCKPAGFVIHSYDETFSLSEVFDFIPPECFTSTEACGVVNSITADPNVVSVSLSGTDSFTVRSSGTLSEPVNLIVSTTGGISASCPVSFINLNLNCDKPNCNTCPDASCLLGHPEWECLDGLLLVPNPFAIFSPSFMLPASAPDQYSVTLVQMSNGFEADPHSGTQSTMFYINDTTPGVPHGYMGAAIFHLSFDNYIGNARVCPELMKVNYTIGVNSYDPNSTLLITGARAALGFYEIGGRVFSRGPYIFVAKVWLRE